MRTVPLIAVLLFVSPALGAGSGVFEDSGQSLGELVTSGVQLGDFDADGDLDAFTTNYVSPSLVWINQGDGTFIDSGQRLGPLVISEAQAVADFDGDADIDVFVAASPFSRVWLNDGTGVFVVGTSFSDTSKTLAAAGDMDGDGDLDLFIGSGLSHLYTIAFNDGSGSFTLSEPIEGPAANGAALGDLDADDDLDVVLAIGGNDPAALGNRVLLNDGRGTLSDSGQSLGETFSDTVALGDLDGDGDLDAFIANSGFFSTDRANTVWLNDGTGIFVDSGQRLGDFQSMDVELADVDVDGDLDAFISNNATPSRLWLNDGTGQFTDSGQLLAATVQSTSNALGDLDGDGDSDAFIAAAGSAGDRILLNVDVVTPGDLNGDGVINVLDLIELLLCFGLPATRPCEVADITADGTVNVLDLIELLLAFGTSCP